MSLATLIATIAIVLDSQILVIGAMVLGPEFGAVAALGVALVRRRFTLLRRAAVTTSEVRELTHARLIAGGGGRRSHTELHSL